MAFTTVGGSGTTSASTASGAGSDLNLFTTPATANMMFLVTVIIAGGSSVATAPVAAQAPTASASPDAGVAASGYNYSGNNTSPVCSVSWRVGNGGHGGNGGHPGNAGKEGSKEHIKTIKMKVGPSTAVHVPVFNSDQSTRTIYVSWNYCGVTF